jgi:chromosome segregation ATPase
MEEFKDACQGLDVRSEELATDLRELPIDYKLAERYMKIDREIREMLEWYENVKKERKMMEERLQSADQDLKHLNNDVQRVKLRAFSHARHGGSLS